MNLKKLFRAMLLTMLALTMLKATIQAQSAPVVFTAGLKAPTKIISVGADSLAVAEAGNGANTGRISLIDRNGTRRTLIDNLPAAITKIAEASPSGPSGLDISGRTLFVTIGLGDATMSGPVQGSEQPNPNPSSPIFSSLLAIHCSQRVEAMTGGFALTLADQMTLKQGGEVNLTNARGERLIVELIADFPDFVTEPRPDFPGNVRSSNPFGVVATGNLLYIVDASRDAIFKVDANNSAFEPLVMFAALQNPTPIGPPRIDVVPDSIRLSADGLLVPTLTGFPFPAGAATVRKVNLDTGKIETLLSNLSSAVDVLPMRNSRGAARYFTLEFSTNMTAQPPAPGRLSQFDAPNAARVTLADMLISPTSLARNQKSGDLFVTEIFTGRIMRIAFARIFVRQHYQDFLGREPDQAGLDFWSERFTSCGTNEACLEQRRVDVSRAFFYSGEFMRTTPELADNLRGTASYNAAFVRECYRRYLQRESDADGLNFWTNRLNNKIPKVTDADYNEIIRAFIVSAEYRSRYGLTT